MSDSTKDDDRGAKSRGLFERPKGSGVWWVRYADEHGRMHREKVGRKALALKVYQKRKNEIAERRFFPEQIRRREVLLSEMLRGYLATVEDRLRSFSDYKRYGKYWTDALGTRPLRQIVAGDVERYVAQRIRQVKPASVNRELQFLKHVFNVAIADGKADDNPVKRVKLFNENNRRVRFLSDDEEHALVDALADEHRPLVLVALHTGLRRENQFQLRWEHIDFATGWITVPRSKSGEAYRVRMNDTLRDALRALPSRMKGPWVFPSATGETPMDAQNFYNRVFVPALQTAKIEGVTWHTLRHTFASRLVMAGVDLTTIKELMGHKDIATTMRYAHLSPGHQLDAVQRLNRKPTDTTTSTSDQGNQVAVSARAEVVELAQENSAPGVIRTPDLLVRSQPL